MKPRTIDTLLGLLLSTALQGTISVSPLGGTLRRSRLNVAGTSRLKVAGLSFLQTSEELLYGHNAFERVPSSKISSIETDRDQEEEESEHTQAMGMSLMLLGGIAFQMSLFYLINFPNPSVVLTIWRVLSTISSLFISMMLYHMMSSPFLTAANRLLFSWGIFLLCYVANSLLVRFCTLKTSAETTQAIVMVSGHVTGFAAMYACADLQKVTQFRGSSLETGLWMAAVALLSAIFLISLAVCMDQVRRKRRVQLENGESNEESQDSVFCLCISFSLVAIIRFCICGDVKDYEHHGMYEGITQAHANQLLVCASVCGLATSLGPLMVQQFMRLGVQSGICSRVVSTMVHLQGLVFAWLILFWGEWQLQLWGFEAFSSILMAFAMTVFGYFAIFFFNCTANRTTDRMCRRSIESLELAVGLLVGITWQKFIAGTIDDFAEGPQVQNSNINPRFLSHSFAFMLIVIVVPAWRFLVLPRTMQFESVHEQEEQSSLEKTLEAAAGRAVKSGVGRNLQEQREALSCQFSGTPHRFMSP